MTDPKRDQGEGLSGASGGPLRKVYTSAETFRDEYERDIAYGALFVPTREVFAAGESVQVSLEFAFCQTTLQLSGSVVAVVTAALSETGATPGVSVQLIDRTPELCSRLEEVTGLALAGTPPELQGAQRYAPRFAARTPVHLESMNRHFPAETIDVSYGGVLALVPGLDLPVSTELQVRLQDPRSGDEITVDGAVVRQLKCHHGYIALGIQLQYPANEIERVKRFVDGLGGFQRARELATVSGSLKENPVDAVLESFSTVSEAGTLRLTHGADDGRIAFADGELLYALTGLVSGSKALSRMFSWTEGSFEFEPVVEPMDRSEPPQPLQGAILKAAVDRDQIARLDLSSVELETTFRLDEERLDHVEGAMDDLSREIANYAGLGFPVSVILDVLTASDAAIYEAVGQLMDGGVITPEPDPGGVPPLGA